MELTILIAETLKTAKSDGSARDGYLQLCFGEVTRAVKTTKQKCQVDRFMRPTLGKRSKMELKFRKQQYTDGI